MRLAVFWSCGVIQHARYKDKDQRIADTAPKAMRAQFREETARVREAL